MLSIPRYPIFLFILTGLVILASQMPAHACSWSGETPTIRETVERADIVVVGQVIGSDGLFSNRAALLVEKYLKGSGPDILFSEGYGSGAGDCKNSIFPWQMGIFYLDGNTGNSESLTASYSYPYSAVDNVTDDTVAKIVQVTGQRLSPIPAPFDIRVRAFGMFFSWILTAIVLFVVPIIFAICFLVAPRTLGIFVVRLSIRRVSALASHRTGI
jgi:hypothetical protein